MRTAECGLNGSSSRAHASHVNSLAAVFRPLPAKQPSIAAIDFKLPTVNPFKASVTSNLRKGVPVIMSIQQQSGRKPVRSVLNQEQPSHILEVSQKDPALQDLHDVVTIISYTGMRRGELQELLWSDVDFDQRSIVVKGKGARRRRVPLERKTLKVLQALRDREPNTELVLGKSPRVLLERASHQLRVVCDRIGMRCSFHCLRRMFLERLMNSGANSSSLMVFGGWKPSSLAFKSFLTGDQSYEIAAREQARMEEQE
jgi:integrase